MVGTLHACNGVDGRSHRAHDGGVVEVRGDVDGRQREFRKSY